MRNVAIHLEDFTMAYEEKPVVWDVDLDIYENRITAMIGPNGAGKSTMLKGILGIEKPISGEVKIFGLPYKKVYKEVAYIPQFESVNWDFPSTVEDVVMMGRYVYRGAFERYRKEDREAVKQALGTVGMEEYARRHISELSGGQKQRVFLARAIAQNAKIYLMDEPFQGVDVVTEEVIVSTMKGFQKEGKTIVVVHHDLSTVEEYFDDVVMMNKKIVAAGSVKEIFTKENIQRAYGGKI